MKESDRGVLVLYYHRINSIQDDPFELCVSEENFDSQMKYIVEHYNVVKFTDCWNATSKGVVVTFDDGYADNFEKAMPILEKYQIPFTVFVSTGQLMNNGIMWWDELYELLVKQNRNEYIEISDDIFGCSWKTNSYEHKLNCYYAIHKLMNHYISIEKKDEWLNQLRIQVGAEDYGKDYAMLTSMQLEELSKNDLVTIGGHTVSHMSLGKLPIDRQEIEIRENLRMLEEIISEKITAFSYPFGREGVDMNDYTLDLLKKYGIVKAATTSQRIWSLEGNEFLIPRCEVKNWTVKDFEKKIEGFWRN